MQPTEPKESGELSAGAQRRQQLRQQRESDKALSWWSQPGVLIFLVALVLAAAGWWLIIGDTQRVPVERASIDGFDLEVVQVRWLLDQMDHGENFQKPSTMMPDMPEWGKQRVTLELAMYNSAEAPQTFDGSEFFLVPQVGEAVSPMGAQTGRAQIGPGQEFNNVVHFDFDTSQPYGKLQIEWRRHGETVYLPVPEPAEHYHLRPRGGEVALPPDGSLLLPLGKARRGEDLYLGVYGCVACHGDPSTPGTNNVGPHLAGVSAAASSRVEGLSGVQYLYESIIDPGAAIAPDCKHGPCTAPTAMPEYASLINLQDAADLLAFLLELNQPSAVEAPGVETPAGG